MSHVPARRGYALSMESLPRCVSSPLPRLALGLALALSIASSARANPLVTETPEGLRLGSPIVFDLRAGVVDASAAPILDAIANAVRGSARVLEIGVHTDSTGSEGFNQSRSQAVADAIRLELIRRGVPAAQLRAVGYGETQPIAPNSTAAGRDANRRVELRWAS